MGNSDAANGHLRSIFDHQTEEEDDKVAAIIEKMKKNKVDIDQQIRKEIEEGKKKIDRQIKKQLKKKYLKF